MGMTPNLGKHRKDLHENKTSHYSIAFLLRFTISTHVFNQFISWPFLQFTLFFSTVRNNNVNNAQRSFNQSIYCWLANFILLQFWVLLDTFVGNVLSGNEEELQHRAQRSIFCLFYNEKMCWGQGCRASIYSVPPTTQFVDTLCPLNADHTDLD